MGQACQHMPALYLCTLNQEDLYRHPGWEVTEQADYIARTISVMHDTCARSTAHTETRHQPASNQRRRTP